MKNIFTNIDFADSEYKSMEMTSGNLTIILLSWDENLIRISFSDVIQFSYKLGDGVADLFEKTEKNNFFDEALSRCYSKIPENHPYKHYALNDIQDFPFIEVIAADINVSKS